ncbi:MAG: LTA synthase family protein [Lachnospiraceae bacterium]|nr:LTA synthase family protein [Lachnospiraceae bacterium]
MDSEVKQILKWEKALSYAGLILCPIVNFYLLEGYTHNGFTEVRHWSQFFNILLLELFAWMLFFVFRSGAAALRTETGVLMVFGLVNYYVYAFRSLPLVPWDLLSLKTAVSVADNYDFTPTVRIVTVVLLFVLLLFLEGFCKLKLEKSRWRARLTGGCIFLVLICTLTNILQKEDFQNRHRMYNKLFTPVFMWQVNGLVLTWVMEMPFLAVEKPSGYNSGEAEELLGEYENNSEILLKEGEMPNMIVVMDEAFSDLSVLGEFQASEEVMPHLHEMQKSGENLLTGYLNVSVCGGNTANTEFEFLTGNTMAFLPQGSIPFQQYIKEEIDAVPGYLKSLGYETYGIHPYHAGGWDRDQVYPLLGFENALFLPDFTQVSYLRNYVDDASCFRKIIRLYENREAPAFIFAVTMQNHGSYSESYNNFVPHITVEGKSSFSLSTYLSLIQKTDEAFRDLIEYFSQEKDPVMVVFFGDHQPNDTVAEPILELNGTTYKTLSQEMRDKRYQVPYVIWTNYETESGKKDISANYLAGEMMERAGLPLPAYHSFLQEMQEEYPVISGERVVDSRGGRVEKKDFGEKIKQYQKLQYYEMFE